MAVPCCVLTYTQVWSIEDNASKQLHYFKKELPSLKCWLFRTHPKVESHSSLPKERRIFGSFQIWHKKRQSQKNALAIFVKHSSHSPSGLEMKYKFYPFCFIFGVL